MVLYSGIWRPGFGPYYWHTGLSLEELELHDENYVKQGFRLWRLGHILNFDKFYGIWQKGSGEVHWMVGLTKGQFKAYDQGFFDKGLRIVDYESYFPSRYNYNTRYAVVWRPGTGAQYWGNYSNIKNDKYAKMGLRLERLEALWRPGTGERQLMINVLLKPFNTFDEVVRSKGLRLSEILVSGNKFSGLWQPGTGEERYHLNVDFDQFEALNKDYSSKGLTLIDMDCHVDPQEGI